MKKERAAAISAVGLMLIAGCSGGRSIGTTPPSLPGGGQQGALVNGAGATLQIMLQSSGAQSSFRARRSGERQTSATLRHPNWVSPYSANANLTVVPANGGSTFSTSFALSTCAYGYNASAQSYYANCSISVPSGTSTFYLGLYDANGYLLSTNQFGSPSPQTVYPNGSAYSNYISVYEQGVLSNISQASPVFCFAAGHPQQIPLYFLDADGDQIVGPLANPITPNFTSYDGAGLGAISLYAYYGGSTVPVSVNGQTLYDTTVYTSPFIYVSGTEGAVNVAATVANIPVYMYGTYSTYTPYGGVAATGTYTAWATNNTGSYGGDLYPIAIQTTLSPHQAVPCQSANSNYGGFIYVGSTQDPSTHNPYLVVQDNNNGTYLFDASATANHTHSYSFFQSSSQYGRPGPQTVLEVNNNGIAVALSNPLIDSFASSIVPGRVVSLTSNAATGAINLLDSTNGTFTGLPGGFYTQIPLNGATRVAGSTSASVVYYDDPGTPYVYGISTSGGAPGSYLTPQDLGYLGYFPGGQIYSLAPSGSTDIFVRGSNSIGSQLICDFNASNFGAGVFCAPISSSDSNPFSMTYDAASGDIVWTTGGTAAYAFSSSVSPSSFITSTAATTTSITLPHAAFRVLGSAGAPGIVGFYGGPVTCTVYPYTANSGEITWMQYSSGTWTTLASVCWPNHYATLTYP